MSRMTRAEYIQRKPAAAFLDQVMCNNLAQGLESAGVKKHQQPLYTGLNRQVCMGMAETIKKDMFKEVTQTWRKP